ncbi:MAG: hypothetical protein JST32_03380 [Bacteroidetes bacterium]|nr:hypothetical protein [Bacteroidota bacterium]
MRLFKRKQPNSREPAVWLVRCRFLLDQRQRQVAAYLGRKTAYWNRSSWIIALALFILLFGGLCLLLCIKAFIHF